MSHHKSNSETEMKLRIDIDRRHMAPWKKWGGILGCVASVAIVISCLPTIGQYGAHVIAIWHCPEQQSTIQNVVSNQMSLQIQVENVAQDVRDIKQVLYHPRAYIASSTTNNLIIP